MRALDRYNLILALLLTLLLWLNQQPAQDSQPILQIDATQVTEIRVVRNRRLQLSVLRDTDGWTMTHPSIVRASGQRTASLLSLLKAPSRWRRRASPELLETYGLQNPVLTISFNQESIHFGESSVPSGQRYVLVGEEVHLIDDSYFRIASLPAKHFRESP